MGRHSNRSRRQKSPLLAVNDVQFSGDPAARGGVAEALRAHRDATSAREEEIARVAAARDASHANRGNADASAHGADLREGDRADPGARKTPPAGPEPRLPGARIAGPSPQP